MSERTGRVRYVAGLMWKADRVMTAVVIAAMVFVSLATGVVALGLRLMLDGAVRADRDLVVVAVAIAAIAKGVENGMSRVYTNQQDVLTAKVSALLDREILALSSSLPGLEHLERPEYLDRVKLVQGRGRDLAQVVPTVIESTSLALRIGVTTALLLSVHPGLLLLPALAVPSVWLTRRSHSVITASQMHNAELSRVENHLHGLFLDPATARELAVFGAARPIDDRCDTAWSALASSRLRAHAKATLIALAGWVSFAAGFAAALAFVVWRVVNGSATPGEILLVSQLAGEVRSQVGGVASTLRGLLTALRTLDRHKWLVDYSATQSRFHGEQAPVPIALQQGLRLDGVSFRYAGSETDVLTDISVDLPAGSTVAIVGENGAGKTTLVKLLCRFYAPTSGAITADGIDIARFDVEEWRHELTATFQDYARLEALARESVGVGNVAGITEAPAVHAALERADATDITAGWPKQLETPLGKTYHDGIEPSGGQWQKLAIARAFMRPRPLVLILDEPTAALDAGAEDALYRRYATAAREARERGAITVLISHRFSTVRMADLIVVLDGGRITEVGTHDELLANGALYAEMFTLQANAYR